MSDAPMVDCVRCGRPTEWDGTADDALCVRCWDAGIKPKKANKEQLAAKQRAYYEANKEQLAAYQRAYYEANKEQLAAKKRAYRLRKRAQS